MSRTRGGFTLIELLVVIAIIAILAAILFPVFARARAKAQQNNCLSNVKELVLSMLMYSADYDQEWFTYDAAQSARIVANAANEQLGWACAIFPYVKNSQIFICPSTQAGYTIANVYGQSTATYAGSDYVMNGSGNPTIGSNLNWVPYPAEQWTIADMGAVNQFQTNGTSGACPTDAWGTAPRIGNPHNNGANVGFEDGHSKWLGFTDAAWCLSYSPCGTLPGTNTGNSTITYQRHFWNGTD
jgi:prepilin-type N-terminal cleavage/methylation domain-containing protein/prepilin-type processing-associated H-X9-DG protein